MVDCSSAATISPTIVTWCRSWPSIVKPLSPPDWAGAFLSCLMVTGMSDWRFLSPFALPSGVELSTCCGMNPPPAPPPMPPPNWSLAPPNCWPPPKPPNWSLKPAAAPPTSPAPASKPPPYCDAHAQANARAHGCGREACASGAEACTQGDPTEWSAQRHTRPHARASDTTLAVDLRFLARTPGWRAGSCGAKGPPSQIYAAFARAGCIKPSKLHKSKAATRVYTRVVCTRALQL